MTTTNTKRIAELNDLCRKAPGIAGKMFLTQGIATLPDADRSAIYEKVETFDSFTPDNDPHREHDFGALDMADTRFSGRSTITTAPASALAGTWGAKTLATRRRPCAC